MGSPILWPCSLALPGQCYPKLPPLRPARSPPNEPLRPAKPGIHTHMISTLSGHAPRSAQASIISAGLYHSGLHDLHRDHAPKACQASNPQTGRISTPRAHALQACQVHAPKAHQLPQKASTCRPVGPHPPATCHRRTPNMPKRHTQTGLDVKGVTSQLRLQFYCFRTGEFFLKIINFSLL
jgi:hypothetical protein